MSRKCFNCGASITRCFGMVKAGDWVELLEGARKFGHVRELCGMCAMRFQWADDGTLIKNRTLANIIADQKPKTTEQP